MARSKKPDSYTHAAQATPLFCGFSEHEIAGYFQMDGVWVAHFEKGEPIYTPDGFRRCIGFLLYGRASVMKHQGGASMLMSVLHPGEIFGAATLFCSDGAYVASIHAQTSAWALMITEDAFRKMLRTDFRLVENYAAYLTGRIRFLSARIDGFVQPSAEERVLAHIQRSAENGVYTPEGSVASIGNALCISRATLYRALKTLEQKNYIKRDGRAFHLSKGENK